nr:unnamed protein product [Spirometra erinaceieuropaei]
MEELLLSVQGCLRSPSQSNNSSVQRRRQYTTHREDKILQRWAEHFRGVLKRPSTISDAAVARLPQVETNADLDLPSSLHETIRAVQQFSTGKAPDRTRSLLRSTNTVAPNSWII